MWSVICTCVFVCIIIFKIFKLKITCFFVSNAYFVRHMLSCVTNTRVDYILYIFMLLFVDMTMFLLLTIQILTSLSTVSCRKQQHQKPTHLNLGTT